MSGIIDKMFYFKGALSIFYSEEVLKCTQIRPGGINILFPLSRPTLLKRADPKYFETKILF